MFVCGACGQRYERGGFCPEDGQPLPETTDALLGTEIGRYRLARMIGEGGMGQVYLAVQPAIGSRVAIKILSDQCARNPELLERFFAEAKAVNLIRHENIVSVIDLAQLPDGRPYIVMEFIEGNTLAASVRGPQRPPIGGVVLAMSEVLSALGAAHQLGIVHRDLKPDNILITGEGHAKVLDFGIAKLAPGLSNALSPRTRTGALLGTPAYMAPEQISGSGNVDARTDLYAAGIVLFEAMTGQVPFTGETLYDLMRAHLEVAPPRPSSLRADLPPAIEDVILQALAKDPKDRFQTAQAMTQAMNHAANGLAPEQWRPLSSRQGMMTGRPSMERSLAPTPPEIGAAPTRVATPIPGPPRGADTLATRRTGTWLALAAAIAVVGGVALIAMSRSGGSAESDSPAVSPPPAMVRNEMGATQPPAVPAPILPPTVAQNTPTPTPTNRRAEGSPAVPTPASPNRGVTPSVPPPPAAPARGPIIVGGGSAADHGVHIGPGVSDGANVVVGGGTPAQAQTPTKFTRPIDYDPKKFDAVAYAPKALAIARSVFPDAGFARLDVYYVYPNGLADLTKGADASSYVFRSPSRSARPTDVPTNVEVDINCYVEVTVSAKAVEVAVRDLGPIDSNCKWQLRPLPKCPLAKVWAKAQADGAKTDTVAKIGFLSDGKWFFDNEFDHEGIVKSYADACP